MELTRRSLWSLLGSIPVLGRLVASQPKKPKRDVLFQILMGIGGHVYTIYTDGSIEGFGDRAIIVNYFDPLLDMAVERSTRDSRRLIQYLQERLNEQTTRNLKLYQRLLEERVPGEPANESLTLG